MQSFRNLTVIDFGTNSQPRDTEVKTSVPVIADLVIPPLEGTVMQMYKLKII